jgi:multidrug resistance efflux pump
VEAEGAGRLEPQGVTEVLLTTRAFSGRLVLQEVLEPGARVSAGDVLFRFDEEEITQAIEEARFEISAARTALDALAERHRIADEVSADVLERKELELATAEKNLRAWIEVTKPLDNDREKLETEQSRRWVQSARDELAQLEKLYAEDELVDETEKIVLDRARFDVTYRETSFALRQRGRAFAEEYEKPERERNLGLAVRNRRAELDRARREATIDRRARAIEMERARRKYARQERDLARLTEDRAAMTVRAPVDGTLLHGPAEGAIDRVFAPRAVVAAQSAVASIIDPESLVAAVMIPVREALRLSPGQTAVISPEAAGAAPVPAVVRKVAPLPRGANFALVIVPDEPLAPRLIGIPVKARVLLEEWRDVLLVPNSAVRRENGRTFAIVLRAPDREEAVDLVLGATDGRRTVVKAGLTEGDEVLPPAEQK